MPESAPTSVVHMYYRSRLGAHAMHLWFRGECTTPGLAGLHHAEGEHHHRVPRSAWRLAPVVPRPGRLYPAAMLVGVDPPAAMFRVMDVQDDALEVDWAPPLAYVQTEVVCAPADPTLRVVGRPQEVQWAGMETPHPQVEPDFNEPDALAREDDDEDAEFYRTPRKLLHVDLTCAARIETLYGGLLSPGMEVLDLMSSWRSHLPQGLGRVVGLGMNREEMQDNPRLQQHLVHDLNVTPSVALPTHTFDAVVNSLSFEYLIHPAAVLAEVRRLLRPGGVLCVCFSDRYFPPKAIRLWQLLHPAERLCWLAGLMAAAGFEDLRTVMERGLARDPDDHYRGRLPAMDPLLAVWGRAPSE